VSSLIWGTWPGIYYSFTVTVLFLWVALSDERIVLFFIYAAVPCQRSPSRVRVPYVSWPNVTLSDLRLPFSSPPTNRRVTVDVFDTTSTRISLNKWKSKLCYHRRYSRPVCLRIKHPSVVYDKIFITVRQLQVFWCGPLSLTRGRVCRLPDSVSSNTSLVGMYNLHVPNY
jgi:hypothetical protein